MIYEFQKIDKELKKLDILLKPYIVSEKLVILEDGNAIRKYVLLENTPEEFKEINEKRYELAVEREYLLPR